MVALLAALLLPGLVSPSGNIRCAYLAQPQPVLLCSIRRADYAAALQDRCLNPNGQTGAGVDWHGFSLGARRGEVLCSGGLLITKPVRYTTLAYGRTRRLGRFTCTSRSTGVTCTTPGHGVFISRQSWRAW
jgi:hypothetical protein